MDLTRGSSGAAVRQLQEALTKLNYSFKPTKSDPRGIDGIFGADTENKVKLFQSNNGLTVDGAWKAADQAKLEQLLAEAEKPPAETNKPSAGNTVTITLEQDVAKALAEALKGVG